MLSVRKSEVKSESIVSRSNIFAEIPLQRSSNYRNQGAFATKRWEALSPKKEIPWNRFADYLKNLKVRPENL